MDRLAQEEAELSISNAPGQNDLVSRLTPVLVLWLGVSAVCAGVLIAAGVFYLLTDEPGLFPGDPPVADLFLELALFCWPFILTGVAGTFVLSRFLAPDSGLRAGGRAVAALLAASVLALVPVMRGFWPGEQCRVRSGHHDLHVRGLTPHRHGPRAAPKVSARTLVDNKASQRVMEKSGLRFEEAFLYEASVLPGWSEEEHRAVKYALRVEDFRP